MSAPVIFQVQAFSKMLAGIRHGLLISIYFMNIIKNSLHINYKHPYKHHYKHPHKHFISDNSRRDSEHKTRADYITILSASAGAAILLVSIIFLLAAVRYYLKIQG